MGVLRVWLTHDAYAGCAHRCVLKQKGGNELKQGKEKQLALSLRFFACCRARTVCVSRAHAHGGRHRQVCQAPQGERRLVAFAVVCSAWGESCVGLYSPAHKQRQKAKQALSACGFAAGPAPLYFFGRASPCDWRGQAQRERDDHHIKKHTPAAFGNAQGAPAPRAPQRAEVVERRALTKREKTTHTGKA